MMTGIRSCSGAMAAFAARVMMVNDSIVSLGGASSKSVSALSGDGGLIQRSHKPAKQNGSPLFNITRNGCLFPSRSCHSKKLSAGIRQGRLLNRSEEHN